MNDAEHLKELEETLLIDSVRNNAEHVSSLLAEEFREFRSSGRCFSKAEIIDLLQTESPVGLSLKDLKPTYSLRMSPCDLLCGERHA